MSILYIVCHVVLFVVLADQVTSTSCHIRNTVVLSTTYLPTSLHWKKTFTVSIFHGLFIWCPVLENVRHSYILHDIFIILYAGMSYLIYLLFENSKTVLLAEIFLCRDWSLSQCAAPYVLWNLHTVCRTFYIWLAQEIFIFGSCCQEEALQMIVKIQEQATRSSGTLMPIMICMFV
jgi:hypothetical protein